MRLTIGRVPFVVYELNRQSKTTQDYYALPAPVFIYLYRLAREMLSFLQISLMEFVLSL